MISIARFLFRWLSGVVLVFVLVVAVVWGFTRQTARDKWQADAVAARSPVMAEYQAQPAAPWQAAQKHADFIKMIQDVYDVEAAKFVRDDYLQVIFSSSFRKNEQSACQAIANIWASQQPQPEVIVDAWRGKTRTAHATVINGRMIKP